MNTLYYMDKVTLLGDSKRVKTIIHFPVTLELFSQDK